MPSSIASELGRRAFLIKGVSVSVLTEDKRNQTTKMFAFINRVVEWFKSLFWKEEMELTLVGLQNSGKTTFVNVIAVSSM